MVTNSKEAVEFHERLGKYREKRALFVALEAAILSKDLEQEIIKDPTNNGPGKRVYGSFSDLMNTMKRALDVTGSWFISHDELRVQLHPVVSDMLEQCVSSLDLLAPQFRIPQYSMFGFAANSVRSQLERDIEILRNFNRSAMFSPVSDPLTRNSPKAAQ